MNNTTELMNSDGEASHLHEAVVAALVLGVLLGVVLITLGIYVCLRCRCRQRLAMDHMALTPKHVNLYSHAPTLYTEGLDGPLSETFVSIEDAMHIDTAHTGHHIPAHNITFDNSRYTECPLYANLTFNQEARCVDIPLTDQDDQDGYEHTYSTVNEHLGAKANVEQFAQARSVHSYATTDTVNETSQVDENESEHSYAIANVNGDIKELTSQMGDNMSEHSYATADVNGDIEEATSQMGDNMSEHSYATADVNADIEEATSQISDNVSEHIYATADVNGDVEEATAQMGDNMSEHSYATADVNGDVEEALSQIDDNEGVLDHTYDSLPDISTVQDIPHRKTSEIAGRCQQPVSQIIYDDTCVSVESEQEPGSELDPQYDYPNMCMSGNPESDSVETLYECYEAGTSASKEFTTLKDNKQSHDLLPESSNDMTTEMHGMLRDSIHDLPENVTEKADSLEDQYESYDECISKLSQKTDIVDAGEKEDSLDRSDEWEPEDTYTYNDFSLNAKSNSLKSQTSNTHQQFPPPLPVKCRFGPVAYRPLPDLHTGPNTDNSGKSDVTHVDDYESFDNENHSNSSGKVNHHTSTEAAEYLESDRDGNKTTLMKSGCEGSLQGHKNIGGMELEDESNEFCKETHKSHLPTFHNEVLNNFNHRNNLDDRKLSELQQGDQDEQYYTVHHTEEATRSALHESSNRAVDNSISFLDRGNILTVKKQSNPLNKYSLKYDKPQNSPSSNGLIKTENLICRTEKDVDQSECSFLSGDSDVDKVYCNLSNLLLLKGRQQCDIKDCETEDEGRKKDNSSALTRLQAALDTPESRNTICQLTIVPSGGDENNQSSDYYFPMSSSIEDNVENYLPMSSPSLKDPVYENKAYLKRESWGSHPKSYEHPHYESVDDSYA